MGKAKGKKFINKQHATTFRLVNRHTDDNNHGKQDFELEPVINYNAIKKGLPQATIEQAEDLIGPKEIEELLPEENHFQPIDMYGFPDDGYDYEQHLKPIGGGKFIPAQLVPVDDMDDLPELESFDTSFSGSSKKDPADDEDLEDIDPDIMELLDSDIEDTGDLQDDFIIFAGEPLDGNLLPRIKGDKPPMPSEPFGLSLTKEERLRLLSNAGLDGDDFEIEGEYYEEDDEEYSGEDFGSEEEDEDDEYAEEGCRAVKFPHKERTLKFINRPRQYDSAQERAFSRVAEEYAEENIGELDADDPEVKGGMDISEFGDILDEFLESQKTIYRDPKDRLVPESVAKTICTDVAALSLSDDEENDHFEPNGDEFVNHEYLASHFNKPDPSTLWDCESILSTNSNLFNHPVLLDENPRIKLSRKTGLPLGYVHTRNPEDARFKKRKEKNSGFILPEESESGEEEDDNLSLTSTNFGEKRAKNETAEEKRERKKAIKLQRQARRVEKKTLKTQYKQEEQRQIITKIKTTNPAGVRL